MNTLRLAFIASLVLLILTGSAVAGHKVELYTTSWCPYCKKARDFFRSRGISFTEYHCCPNVIGIESTGYRKWPPVLCNR